MMADNPKKPFEQTYHKTVADELIERIREGTAPWQQPWEAGTIGTSPFNPESGTVYAGLNNLVLTVQGYNDPRWMTYKQAQDVGAQVRKGEKGTRIEFYKFTGQRPKLDDNGQPVLGADGKEVMEEARLERPIHTTAVVFNVQQMDGYTKEYQPRVMDWSPVEEAERLLSGTGVDIRHDQRNSAFFQPAENVIHMPDRADFKSSEAYYATALHEVGHATGHNTRMARDFAPFGTEGYAREELRAEITSFMVARELGIGHDPGQHATYVESWVKALKDDPREIVRAARDAEKMASWIMEPEKRQELNLAGQKAKAARQERGQKQPQAIQAAPAPVTPPIPPMPRDLKAFDEQVAKCLIKNHGWDQDVDTETKRVFAKKDIFQNFGGGRIHHMYVSGKYMNLNAFDESAEKVRSQLDVDLQDFRPFIDKPEEVAREFDLRVKEYVVEYEGRSTNPETQYRVDLEIQAIRRDRAAQEAQRLEKAGEAPVIVSEEWRKVIHEAKAAIIAREIELAEKYAKAAEKAHEIYQNASPATEHPYLDTKKIKPYGLKASLEDQHGISCREPKLIIPIRNADGALMSLRFIDGRNPEVEGSLRDGRTTGGMHVIDPAGELAKKPIIITQDYATAATIYEATGNPAVVAFEVDNFEHVAKVLREKHPHQAILIAANNGHKQEKQAEAAAHAVGGSHITPQFPPPTTLSRVASTVGEFLTSSPARPPSMRNFNDLMILHGPNAVRNQLGDVLERLRTQSRTREPSMSI